MTMDNGHGIDERHNVSSFVEYNESKCTFEYDLWNSCSKTKSILVEDIDYSVQLISDIGGGSCLLFTRLTAHWRGP